MDFTLNIPYRFLQNFPTEERNSPHLQATPIAVERSFKYTRYEEMLKHAIIKVPKTPQPLKKYDQKELKAANTSSQRQTLAGWAHQSLVCLGMRPGGFLPGSKDCCSSLCWKLCRFKDQTLNLWICLRVVKMNRLGSIILHQNIWTVKKMEYTESKIFRCGIKRRFSRFRHTSWY